MTTNQHSSTALLVMDIQAGFLDRVLNPDGLKQAIPAAIDAARKAGIPVFYVVVGFRKGLPEVNPRNKSFGALRQNPAYAAGLEEPIQIEPVVKPLPGEVVITKRRISAFAGSDLDVVLRAHNIHHLVLTGISTSGVVLSTLREAADKDYSLTVLSDGCSDGDAEVHNVLVTKVFPRHAAILTAAEWVASIQG
jgi:nicotinamidase-related amidase